MTRTRTYSTRLGVKIHGDVGSVVQWWTSSSRLRELRADFERNSASDFSWQEAVEDGKHTARAGWINGSGMQFRVRIEMAFDPGGVIEPDNDGLYVLREEFHQYRRHRNGNEDTIVSQRVYEFREAGSGLTSLHWTATPVIVGMSGSEYYSLRISQRAFRMWHLRRRVRRCESDLAAIAPTGSSDS
jgi:hypothetical protein